jgi:hypothetical protein
MLDRRLSPLERFDFGKLHRPGVRLWLWAWYWALMVAIALRLFVNLPDIFWNRAGQWSVTLGVWLAFIVPVNATYQIIARRVKDGTLLLERLIPISVPGYLWSKLKVVGLAASIWAGPCFLMGLLSDPTLAFARGWLARALLLPDYDSATGYLLPFLAALQFVVFWLMMTLFLVRLAIEGRILIELAGSYIFWGLAILLGLSWLQSTLLRPGQGGLPSGGFLDFLLIVVALVIGLSFLLLMATFRRLGWKA